MYRYMPLFSMFFLGLLVGCQSAAQTAGPDPSVDPAAAVEPEVIGECFISIDVEVYIDAAVGDGGEPGDKPLRGVQVSYFRPGDALDEPRDTATISDTGRAELGFILGGDDCDLSGYKVGLMALPDGYMAPNLMVDLGDVQSGSGTLQIAFALLPIPGPGAEPSFSLASDSCFQQARVAVWEDFDADGIRDPEELPLKDVAIGFFQAGEEVPSYDLRRTSREGLAELSFIVEGSADCDLSGHRIGVVVPPGGYLASAVELASDDVGVTPVQVSMGLIADPEPGPELRVGLLATECFRGIYGEVWEDRNADGLRSADEPPLEGVRVALLDPDGGYGPDDSLLTTPQGTAEFGFVLREGGCDLTGYSFGVLFPPPGYLIPDAPISLAEMDEGATNLKVGIGLVPDPQPGPTPEGQLPAGQCFRGVFIEAWEDANGNGLRDLGEWPVHRVNVGLVRPGETLQQGLLTNDEVDTTLQGYAQLGFVVAGPDCDLAGYRLLIMRTPAGIQLPENPVVDLAAIDTGDETLQVKIGLMTRED